MSCLFASGAVGDIIYSSSIMSIRITSQDSYAVNPFRVEERLVNIGRAVVPMTFHVEVLGSAAVRNSILALKWYLPLKRNCSTRSNLLGTERNRKANLTCHTRTTNNGPP
jgi:hypothetical protein